MKSFIISAIGAAGTAIAHAFGGWDASIIALLSLMAIDYLTGFIVASVFHKSKKSESGGLESRAGWKGICKKCTVILLVVAANLLDMQLGASFVRDGVCIAFISNELLSILENAALMGLPIPKAIQKALDILNGEKEKGEQ